MRADSSPIAHSLIAWHREYGRHDLPWQIDRTPYRVWVSEIMLQQTQVVTVLNYYSRFMQRFPSIRALAEAPPDEVLHLWTGLGYYSRARNLQRAAQQIVAEQGGELPRSLAGLSALPGIGRSTAAAILSLAFCERAAILDGNVRRVLSRFFGIEGDPNDKAVLTQLWQRAESCTPQTQVDVYTQAIMDFGATQCTRAKPNCIACPLRRDCQAYQSDRVAQLPTPRRRAARQTRAVVMVLAVRPDGGVLLRRRPPRGIWGGLWTPPEFESRDAAADFCVEQLDGAHSELQALPSVEHSFTHFDLHITPFRAQCLGADGVMEAGATLWYNARDPARVGLPAPIATLLTSPGILA